MNTKSVYTKPYYRSGTPGRKGGFVCGYQSERTKAISPQSSESVSKCPRCGMKIKSRQMPSGGIVAFEAGLGLSRVPHPCFTRGKGLSKNFDEETPDLLVYNGMNKHEMPPRWYD